MEALRRDIRTDSGYDINIIKKGFAMTMKYVMNKDLTPLLFPVHVQHVTMKHIVGPIVTAGFCRVVDNKVEVWGKSISLNLKSDPSDALVIECMMKDH